MRLSAEILKQIRQIQIKAGFLSTDAMAGEYSSIFRGLGQEFEKVREYQIGDDVRSIDWNVTARMNEPFVKVHREEREMTLMLLVDVSPSQRFGSNRKFKHEISAELVAMLASLAIKNSDKVGLIIFSDHVEELILPKKGRAHVWRMINAIFQHESKGKSTDIAGALNYFLKIWKKKCTCFLISDFEAKGFEKAIHLTSKRHELICIQTKDPREDELAKCGIIELLDPETGQSFVVNTDDSKTQALFEQNRAKNDEDLERLFRQFRIDHFKADTSASVVKVLMKFFKKRERRASGK